MHLFKIGGRIKWRDTVEKKQEDGRFCRALSRTHGQAGRSGDLRRDGAAMLG